MYCRHALSCGRIVWLAAGLVWTLVASVPAVSAQALPKPKPPSTASKSVKPKRQPLPAPPPPTPVKVKTWQEIDKEVAARFAPSFYQGMAGTGRFDDITNFDFDGDWIGDNNWEHAADKKYPLRGHIYYSLTETTTHYFIHYAVFHPRDWKGGEKTGRLLSSTIREGTTLGHQIQPRGLADDIVLAHENDLEGCVVVAAKHGPALEDARIVLVETVAHNHYLRYAPPPVPVGLKPLRVDGDHPLLYVEPKGHGIQAYADQATDPNAAAVEPSEKAPSPDDKSVVDTSTSQIDGNGSATTDTKAEGNKSDKKKKGLFGKVKDAVTLKPLRDDDDEELPRSIRVYRFTGTPDNPDTVNGAIGYDLIPIFDTLWKYAGTGRNETFGEANDYGDRAINVLTSLKGVVVRTVSLGLLGSALRGSAGAPNKARPPWGWFDMTDRDRPLGEWFLDPAGTISRHLSSPTEWELTYLHHPYFGVYRDGGTNAPAASPATKAASAQANTRPTTHP